MENLRMKYDNVIAQNETLLRRIDILENNQKKINYPKKGMVYIIRPAYGPYKDLFKPGKTFDFDNREKVYNITVPDNVEVLYTLVVDDPDSVETCFKNILKPYAYRGKKEYFRCDLEKSNV
jgi:hypothetical protein